jgi:plastocyanin
MKVVQRLLLSATTMAAVLAFNASQIGEASASTGRTVDIVGTSDLGSPGQPYEFKQGRIVVHTGESVTWRNETSDPHSISVVDPSDEPRTLAEMNDCATCNQLLNLHAPNIGPDGPQPPFVAALDSFAVSAAQPARLDSRGDSLLVAEHGNTYPSTLGGTISDSVTAVITAPRGATLNYICALHPWMQGVIEVR